MSDQENSEFDFLDQFKKNGEESAIIEKNDLSPESEPDTVEAEDTTSETLHEESSSDAAWMDNPDTSDDKHDSSTRFAAALGDHQEVDLPAEQENVAADNPENSTQDANESAACDDPEASENISATGSQPSEQFSHVSNTTSQPLRGSVVPKKKYVLVLSYASAITLVCLILLMQSLNAKPHELESLPDLKPPMNEEQIAYRLVPESAKLPRGHTLKLGESRRFGNLLVTPVKVVYEPIRFVHYSKDPAKVRTASDPVMKLWLKFENVSKDQTFSPLDRKLILTRIVDSNKQMRLRSNQFLCPVNSKGNLDKTDLLYDLEMLGDWNFAGTEDAPLIQPGHSVEIYLPSDENSYEQMDGKIVWRVQFRKGYHPVSKRGVTTLIEVIFNKNDVTTT